MSAEPDARTEAVCASCEGKLNLPVTIPDIARVSAHSALAEVALETVCVFGSVPRTLHALLRCKKATGPYPRAAVRGTRRAARPQAARLAAAGLAPA